MGRARMTVTGLTVATVISGLALTGCGNSGKSSAPSSGALTATSPAGPPPNYSALLIQPGDIGGDFTAPQPPVLNANNNTSVAQLFVNADNSRRIGDTILVVADPGVAAAALENTKTNYAKKVTGTWQPVDVGTNGAMISGTSQDNSQAIAVLLFTEGRALVNLEFDSAPSDPIDPAVATDVGRKQAAAVRNGLH
jgi:ABC-type glycerol-3-phosphate transport system substrate-binding protein